MIGGMKKGLFGKSRMMPDMMEGYGGGRFTPGIGDGQNAPSMPQNETMQHTPEMQRMLAGVPLPKQGMDWKNVALSALGGAADGAAQHFGMAPLIAMQRNQQAQMQAQAQRDQAMRIAGMEDYRAKKGIDAEFKTPDTPKVGSFEWWSDPARTPQEKQAYGQYMDYTNPAMATTWQGPTILPRSQIAGMGGNVPTAPVGRLTPIDDAPAPTILNTPAPQVGANGMPAAVNRAQYQAIVEAMGPQQAADWARRNNVRVGQ
jgi:hypothetical protein